MSLVSIMPQSILAWNHWRHQLTQDAWFAVLNENILTIAALEQGRIAGLRSVLLPQNADQKWLAAYLERIALLLDIAPAKALQVCGADQAFFDSICTGQQSSIACSRLDAFNHAHYAQLPANLALSAAANLANTGNQQIRANAGAKSKSNKSQSTQSIKLDFAKSGVRRSLWQGSMLSYLAGAAGLIVCLSLLLQLSLQHFAAQRLERQSALKLVQQRALKNLKRH